VKVAAERGSNWDLDSPEKEKETVGSEACVVVKK
jgi:hypothetical protein